MRHISKEGEWVTNVPKSIKSLPRREGVELRQGPPKSVSHLFPVEELERRRLVGAYLAHDIPEGYYNRPKVAR